MTGASEVAAFRPRALREALELKARHGAALTAVAGGTDFMVLRKVAGVSPAAVMDLAGIGELSRIEERPDGLFVGAGATFSAIMESPAAARRAPLLCEAARAIGSRQIRNRATIGGNVASGSPAADSVPALWALGAEVALASAAAGERRVPLASFFTGYRASVLRPDELIAGFAVPRRTGRWAGRFYKVGPRKAQAIAKVSLAALARLRRGTVDEIRLAAGSVGPTALGLEGTMRLVAGRRLSAKIVEEARAAAAAEVRPMDDVRSTEHYRRTVAGNLVARFLRDLMDGEIAPAAL